MVKRRGFTIEAAAILVSIVKLNIKHADEIEWDNRRQLGGLIVGLMERGMIEYDTEFSVTLLGMEKYREIQQMKIWR